MKRILSNLLLALVLVASLNYTAHPDRVNLHDLVLTYPGRPYLSPSALVTSHDGKQIYIACSTANHVGVYDIEERKIVREIEVAPSPTGLALSPDGEQLFVTCAAPRSKICIIQTSSGKVHSILTAGHTTMAPVLSPDGSVLYVCNRFNNSVEIFNLADRGKPVQVPVDREPVAAALSPDGKLLFVANHIHSGRADRGVVAASVSVIDTASRKLLKNIPLTNGSTLLRDICVSPDGRYVGITHVLARFHLPTTTVAHGWMNNNALSLIDVSQLDLLTTVLLDQDNRGAANPWAAQWSPDGKLLCVTHAGTHEVSIIDAPGLLAKIRALPLRLDSPAPKASLYSNAALVRGDIPNDLTFLDGLRSRIKLHAKGPRALAFVGNKIFVGDYFSDALSILDRSLEARSSATIQLETPLELIPTRKGELAFNDATLCYQGWQSCASCHSSDARIDGMNWDLLNDGIGNPKNVKSLLLAFQTPPVMAMGVRSDASAAIRAGIRHILFTEPREPIASAIDEYIKSLQPIASPHLVHNRLSPSAKRGSKLFFSPAVGCADCHPPPLFTDLKPHAVGTGKYDERTDEFYTPTLIELWRTAPYLHDGSAASLRDLILSHNPGDPRGKIAQLTPEQVGDLVEYLLAL
jgi:DNA-binding beta-propeller fold protein YncE